MNLEHQCLEWKASWKDDHLREICAFANAQGGTLCIGLDDHGQVTGVPESAARKLLENLPNKVRDVMGVQVDVNLRKHADFKHGSKAINPLIARAFYRAGHVESWGRGIKRIADACREYGTAPQTYSFTDSEVVTVFEVSAPDERSPRFTDRQLSIVAWLREHPDSSRKDVAAGMGLSIATLKREFDELSRLGVLVRVGEKKAARWNVL